jgi:hypothetical protein
MLPYPPDPEEEEIWRKAQSSPPPSGRLRHLVQSIWNPVPIAPPRINPHLGDLGWPERSAEVVRFTILGAEHWLSQRGLLREWIRVNLWLAIILTVAAVLLVPPVTAVLEGAAEWTELGSQIVGNVTDAILKLPPVVLGLATLFLVVRFLQRQWLRRRHTEHARQDGWQ